jgi:hypothetical protein
MKDLTGRREIAKEFSSICNAIETRITIYQPSTKVCGIAKGGMYV